MFEASVAWDGTVKLKPLFYKGPLSLKAFIRTLKDWAEAHGFTLLETKHVEKGDELEKAFLFTDVRKKNIFEEEITLTLIGVDITPKGDVLEGKFKILIEGSYKVVSKKIVWQRESRLNRLFDWLTQKPLKGKIKSEFIDPFEEEVGSLMQAVKRTLGLPAFESD